MEDNKIRQQDEITDEEIDENLKETFPASDPPSWTLGTNHRNETSDEEDDDESRD